MFISKIILKNFKSFGKRTEIPFVPGFTVISGPNGSGKSNVIDAILFCLGLSTSTKQLRADRLTDLIHNGKTSAEVSIHFKNENRVYEVTRKVRVTDKGYYSYYYLNGNSVSLSDVHKFLSQFGVYSDAYNIVMQGDVTRIIEMSPVQRRKIIDDIAGISEFDEKKERALEELERVRENIEKLEAVIAEVDDRLKSLERDREEALRYKSLVEERERMELAMRAHEYLSLRSSMEKLEREIERLERSKDAMTARLPGIMTEIRNLTDKVDEITSQISEMGDERLSEVQTRILELTSEIESIKNSERFYLDEIRRIDDEIVSKLNDVSKLEEEMDGITKELESSLIRRANISEIVEELEGEMEKLKKKLEAVGKEHRELKDRLVELRKTLDGLNEERSNLLRSRDAVIEVLRRANMDIDEIGRRNEELERELNSIMQEMRKVEGELDGVGKELESRLSKRNEIDRKLFSIRSELSDVEERLKDREVELAKVRAKLSTLQTYSKSVELILDARSRRELPGVFGTVAQLGEVEEKYVAAIEAAAGSSLQYIVVETEDDAVECINYLKAVRGGRATFIPLRRVKNFNVRLDKSLLNEPGVVDYAVRLVKCDRKFQPVFRFVLRDTLVVDRIETARRLMDRGVRLVTLDGDIVEKSGLMSGGSYDKNRGVLVSRELLEREKELSDEIQELEREKELLLSELNRNESMRKEVQGSIGLLEERKAELERKLKLLEGRRGEIENRIMENDEIIGRKKKEVEVKSSELKEIGERIQRVEEEIRKVKSEMEKVEKKLGKSEIPKITEQLDRLREEYSRNREILISIDEKVKTLEFKRRQVESSIEEKRREAEMLRNKKAEMEKAIEEGRRRISELRAEIEELRREEEKVGETVKALREERDRYMGKLRELDEEKRRIEFEIDKIDERLEVERERLSDLERKLEEFEEIEIPDDLPTVSYVRNRLSELQNEIDGFGDVNLKAIQEYEEVKARKEELVEKKMVLEKERMDIIEKIERYEKRKREVFYETFNAINRNFAEVIRELTNGEGELYLESDDPFSSGLYIRVKPQNKPVQKLESMSGGEKSLVALALIFAIQMFKPAPFYAFDEVDMFLDGVNVARVARVLRERSKDAQFIVVSLRKPMIEQADAIVGITMGRDHSSMVTGIKLRG